MKRAIQERSPAPVSAPEQAGPDLERRMAALASLNQHFGAHRLVTKFLWAWFQPQASYRVLDLTADSGDVPGVIADWCEPREITVRVDALVEDPASLEVAKRKHARRPNIQWICGNPLTFEASIGY